MALVEFEHVEKYYGDYHALRDINLRFEKGQVVVLLGPSGSGKSTLIRTVNLLERPAEGKVIVDGEDLMTLSKSELLNRRKKIGMIFQHFNLMKNLSCLENVLFPIKKDNTVSKKERLEKAESFLERVGLSEYRNRYPSELSGGQKQRVAIASALASQREIMIFDEPTSGLDLLHMRDVAKELTDLSQIGKTVLVVTHDYELIASCCTYILHLENGMVKEQYPLDLSGTERLKKFFLQRGDSNV